MPSGGQVTPPAAALMGAALLLAALARPASAQVLSVTLQKPARDFGILVGDLLTSRATVTVEPGTVLDRRSVPQPGPAGAALDIRETQVLASVAPEGSRIQLQVTYQNFRSPEQVSEETVPGYTLALTKGSQLLTVAVPGFAYTVSPFRHDLQPVLDPAVLRPDHPALLADTGAPARDLALGGGLALLAAGALLVERWRPGGRGPFATALRGMARGAAGSCDGWLALHRAFDATLGRRVLADDVGAFVAAHPCFGPMRNEIEQFFADSRKIFFGDGTVPQADVLRIGRALARAEQRR